MSSKYKKYVTYTAVVGVLTLSVFPGGYTKESSPEAGDATPSEVNVVQAVPETIIQLGLDGQVSSGLDDVNLSDVEPIPEHPRARTRHEITKRLQQHLMDLGFMDSDEPTDYFEKMTRQAVKYFQRQSELPVDGIVDNITWSAIMSPEVRYYAVPKGTQGDGTERIQQHLYEPGRLATADLVTGDFGDSTGAIVLELQEVNELEQGGRVGQRTINLLYSDEVKPNLFSYDEKSDVALACQECLKELGYLTTTPDEAYGEGAVVAVKQFQARSDQVAGGYLGSSTRITLSSPDARTNDLMLGERGDVVTKVQQLLNKHGYFVFGNVTGYYGEAAENAVKNFQSRNGLTSDGLVSAQAMAKLISDNIRRPAANSGGSGTTIGPGSSGSSGNTRSNDGSGNTDKSSGNTTPPVSIPSGGGTSTLIPAASFKLGSPYVWEAKGPNFFDCSGLVYWCSSQVGVNQSYLISSGWRGTGCYTKIINFSDIQADDIVVTRGHVGIAAGGGTVIDALSSSERVVHRSLSQWWTSSLICAWRIS